MHDIHIGHNQWKARYALLNYVNLLAFVFMHEQDKFCSGCVKYIHDIGVGDIRVC